MIDGVHLGDPTIVIALGVDMEGIKHILGPWQGSTVWSIQVVKTVLEELVKRGTYRPDRKC